MKKKSINWWKTNFGRNEINSVKEAIENKNISQGPIVKKFEEKLAKKLDCKYAVLTTSGSTAMLMSCIVTGISNNDEVIVPNRTWISTVHAPYLLGAKIKIAEINDNSPLVDENKIEKLITKKTKAIIPVHMGGRCVNMKKISKIAKKYNCFVIEDAAQALLSKNRDIKPGKFSDLTCYSFSVAKLISTGQGGFITTNNRNLYNQLRLIRTHGVENVVDVKYKWPKFGFNFRFNDILSSIGLEQLKQIEAKSRKLKTIYKKYYNGLENLKKIKLIPVDIKSGEIPLYVEVLCRTRVKLINFLKKNSIEARPFYPDISTANYLNKDSGKIKLSNYHKYGLYLPTGPNQKLSDIDRVISKLQIFDRL